MKIDSYKKYYVLISLLFFYGMHSSVKPIMAFLEDEVYSPGEVGFILTVSSLASFISLIFWVRKLHLRRIIFFLSISLILSGFCNILFIFPFAEGGLLRFYITIFTRGIIYGICASLVVPLSQRVLFIYLPAAGGRDVFVSTSIYQTFGILLSSALGVLLNSGKLFPIEIFSFFTILCGFCLLFILRKTSSEIGLRLDKNIPKLSLVVIPSINLFFIYFYINWLQYNSSIMVAELNGISLNLSYLLFFLMAIIFVVGNIVSKYFSMRESLAYFLISIVSISLLSHILPILCVGVLIISFIIGNVFPEVSLKVSNSSRQSNKVYSQNVVIGFSSIFIPVLSGSIFYGELSTYIIIFIFGSMFLTSLGKDIYYAR